MSAVEKTVKKPIIGILGGIGSGKSTVAAEFGRLGCAVIDADAIVHELLDKADTRERIVNCFGDGILDSAGRIDNEKLARIAFSRTDNVTMLNNILHPSVLRRTEQLIAEYNREPFVKAIVLDMPLLLEVGWAQKCDKLVFIECQERFRAQRAKKKHGFDKNQLKFRENFQISLDKKVSIADNVVSNNSDYSYLAEQVEAVFTSIVNKG